MCIKIDLILKLLIIMVVFGYQSDINIISNLVCLCWGGGRTGANNTTFVNFPVTYSDSVRITAVSVDNDNSIVGINTHGVSFNGFYAHCKDSNNRFWAQSFNYIAIGY